MKKHTIGIIALLVLILLFIILVSSFEKAYCTQVYIDINSGDIREQKYVMFFKISETVKATDFSKTARDLSVIQNTPIWEIVQIRDTLFHKVFIYSKWHGSISECEKFTELLKMKEFPVLKQKELIEQVLIHLKNGEIDKIEEIMSDIV